MAPARRPLKGLKHIMSKHIMSKRVMSKHIKQLLVLLALPLLVATACGDEEETAAEQCAASGAGELVVDVYGEEFIEEGIPAEELVDGWAITFDTFLIHLSDVGAARAGCGEGLEAPAGRVFDVAQGSGGTGAAVASGEVPAGTYNEVTYRIAPAGAGAAAGNVTADQATFMADNGYAVYVEGAAEKGGVRKTFRWGFATTTRYTACEGTGEVGAGGGRTELTIHGDHLFYDDLFSEEPNVAFQLIADADADGDGEVTEAELRAKDITSEERYQVGSEDIDNLYDYIAAQTRTLGHIDGEGHCETE